MTLRALIPPRGKRAIAAQACENQAFALFRSSSCSCLPPFFFARARFQ
jgi:hypothetical protein